MKKVLFTLLYSIILFSGYGQLSTDSIKTAEVETILRTLSHDSLKGRGNYSRELFTAAKFIANQRWAKNFSCPLVLFSSFWN